MDLTSLFQASTVVMTVAVTILTIFFTFFTTFSWRSRKRSEMRDQIIELKREQQQTTSNVSSEASDTAKGQDFRSFFSNIERFEYTLKKNEFFSERQLSLLEEISERQKKVEQALTGGAQPGLLSAGLEVEDKMRYISAVTSDVAHALGTPLSGLKASVALIKRELNGQGSERLKNIENSIRAIEDTIEGYSQLGLKAVTPTHERVDLRDRLEAAFKVLALSVTKKVHLDFSIPPLAVPEEFYKLLMVPLSAVFQNALEAMDDNGVVKTTATEDGNWLSVSIHNSGPPVDASVGDIYERGVSSKGSTGLGLTIAKRIVTENLGGKLYHRNEGDGVTFTLEVPANRYV